METAVLCRVCLESVLQKHATALFTDLGTRMKWAPRLEELLFVSVSEGDSSPQHICRVCRRKVEATEKNLAYLREKAHASYERISHTSKLVESAQSLPAVPSLFHQLLPKQDLQLNAILSSPAATFPSDSNPNDEYSSTTPKKLHHVYR